MSHIFSLYSPVVASVYKKSQELRESVASLFQLIVEPRVYSETIVFPWFGIGSQKENITNWEENMPSFIWRNVAMHSAVTHTFLKKGRGEAVLPSLFLDKKS